MGLNHGRRVVDRISVDEALPEPLAGDLVGADPGESMDVRGRLAGAPLWLLEVEILEREIS